MTLGFLMVSCLISGGCRSNTQNPTAYRWPWSPTSPAASQVAASGKNGPWAPVSSPQTPPIGHLQSIFHRDEVQSKLANDQRKALEDLALWQKRQEEELQLLSQERHQKEIANLQEQASIVAAQREELEQVTELRRRALELDTNNSELHAQLAQAEQQKRLLEDQMQVMKDQLRDAASQLQQSLTAQRETEQRVLQAQNESHDRLMQVQSEAERRMANVHRDADQRVSALQATIQRRGSATITANSSLRRSLTPVSVAGLMVRPDGDVIRIELPSDKIFSPGTAALQESSGPLLEQVAETVQQNYPQQRIGIEAYTDNGPIQNSAWRNAHQLTAAQAMAVLEFFVSRHQFPTHQLFQIAQGANHPIASNATAAGRQRNRRVEVVIYPETVSQR